MSLRDFEGMHWKSLDEMDSSYVAMIHFKRLLENVKERNPRKIYCSLDEELNYTELPGLVTADSGLITHGRAKMPLSANFLLKVRNEELNEIDVNFIGYINRELDQDNKFRGYPARIVQELRHQGGIRLRHLLPLNLEIYFRNQFDREGALIKVDERLVEGLLISGIEAKIDTIHC